MTIEFRNRVITNSQFQRSVAAYVEREAYTWIFEFVANSIDKKTNFPQIQKSQRYSGEMV